MYIAANSSQRDDGFFGRSSEETIPAPGIAIDTGQIAGWLLRGWMWILTAMLLGAVAGVVVALMLTPRFTATTDITIAPSNLLVAPNDLYANNIQTDSQILDVESKMRMITSGNVLRRVIDALNLKNDPEFA